MNIMKVRFESPSVLTTFLLLFMFSAATPALAQTDFGDLSNNTVAEIGASDGDQYLGLLATTDDGVTKLGPALENGTLYVNVVTNAAGYLHVWIDENSDDDFTDQANQQTFNLTAGAPATFNIPIAIPAAIAGTRNFRFIFEKTNNTIVDPNTDYSAKQGEIEDYAYVVQASGSLISLDAFAAGVTTTIDRSGGNIEVSSGAPIIFSAPIGDIGPLVIFGHNTGDDVFNLDFSNGNIIPGGGLTVNGGGDGGGGDSMTITDGSSNTTVTHTFFNVNDGTVEVDDGTLTYTGLEPIVDNVPTAARVFTFTAGADTIVMKDSGGGADSVIEIDSDNSEKVTFDVSITTTIEINAGGGADDITIELLDSVMPAALVVTVDGEGANDTLNLDLASDGVLAVADLVFNGDAGSNQLNLLNNSYTALTVDYDTGTIDVGLGNDITFADVATLDIDLTIRVYTFDLTGGNDTAVLEDDGDAGDGESSFEPGTTSTTFNTPTGVLSRVEVNAEGGSDFLTVGHLDSTAAHDIEVYGEADGDSIEHGHHYGYRADVVPDSTCTIGIAACIRPAIFA